MGRRRIEVASIEWREGQAPRSRLYGEGYFSDEDALAEARAVFLAGCGLPERWAGRRRFVVGELGLGAGRNLVALLDLWRRTKPAEGRLHVFSVEAHPMSAAEARRALAAWPDLQALAARLTAQWPPPARGFYRIDFGEIGATVDFALMEAADALRTWAGRADAWFLDGFSPARNPAMWRPELLRLVADRSAPGARAASFTAAGAVRREMTAAGFAVERRPGFGRKRHRLEARFPGEAAPCPPLPKVAIVGAGIAGAALARAFEALGLAPRIYRGADGGASAGPAALVAPRLDAGLGPPAALFAQAFARAIRLYAAVPDAILARGALVSGDDGKDAARFQKIAQCDLFAPGTVRLTSAEPPMLALEDALVIEPDPILSAWIGASRATPVSSLAPASHGWRLLDAAGEECGRADLVCLAAGMDAARLAELPLTPVRGQASVAIAVDWPQARLFAGGYALPTRTGVIFGATHDRGDSDPAPREGDHQRNLHLATRLPALAAAVGASPLSAHAGVRATTRDYLPLAGAAPDGRPGLFVLAGLGSRGFTLAPLLAEHVAALALGVPSPLPAHLARLVDPARFAERQARRGASRPNGAGGRGRTDTLSPEPDFESGASANSATPARQTRG